MPDPTSGPPEREPGRVLVVEDEEEANDELVWALVDAGFAVASARDGDQALAILEVSAFDLMILDLIMPRIGGIAVIEEVRKRKLDLPIVLISEAIGLLDKHRFGEFGISHVVRKPLKMDALVALVRQVVTGRQPARRSGGGSERRKTSP